MSKLNKTTTFLVFSTTCALVAGGVYLFFFISIKDKTQEAITLATQAKEFSDRGVRYAALASSLKTSAEATDKLSGYFIKESEIVTFTKKIEALGPKAGVKLSIQSLEPGLAQKDVAFLNFRIVAEGKFENIEKLLFFLQNFPGKFEWNNLRLTREGDIESGPGSKAPKVALAPQWKAEATLMAFNFVKE